MWPVSSRVNDAFQILGLDPVLVYSPETLRDAFREAGKRVHPDGGGGEAEFARLQEAFEVLSSPARRLKHWMELRGTPVEIRGTIGSAMMDVFSEVGKVTQQAEAMIRKRDEAKSALFKAMLEGETQVCREQVEAMIARLDGMIRDQCSEFPELEIHPDGQVAAEVVRNLTFLEKWRMGLRSCFSRLI